jgi:hypothetical protein
MTSEERSVHNVHEYLSEECNTVIEKKIKPVSRREFS